MLEAEGLREYLVWEMRQGDRDAEREDGTRRIAPG